MKNKIDLEKIKRVRLNDYSEYKAEKSCNGGCYGFWTDYNRVENGWEVSYGTTSDFTYCPCCGSFDSHYDYEAEEYACGDFDVIATEELQKIISEFKEDEKHFIEFVEMNESEEPENVEDTKTDEIIYRRQLMQYHILDAENQWEQYREQNDIQDIELAKSDYEALAEKFETTHDCNIADNVQWQNIIANYIKFKKNM